MSAPFPGYQTSPEAHPACFYLSLIQKGSFLTLKTTSDDVSLAKMDLKSKENSILVF